jgi:hypothetical protein
MQSAQVFCPILGRQASGTRRPNRKAPVVDIRIGILNAPRELSFESAQTSAEITEQVSSALSSGTVFLKLTDNKGKLYIVPTAGIAYVEVGTEESRRIGFVG